MVTWSDPANLMQPSVADADRVVELRALRQPIGPRAWGVVKTSLLGAVSFGILPLLIWTSRFREFAAEEARQFRAVADFSRRSGRAPSAVGPLRAAAESLQALPFLWIVPLLLALFVIGAYAIEFNNTAWTWSHLLDTTYRIGLRGGWVQRFQQSPSSWTREQRLYLIWCGALSIAYLCHFAQVRLHRADVERFLSRFRLMSAPGSREMTSISSGLLINPLLIAAAVAFLHYGAWWGIPMLLAGAAQKRYTFTTSRIVRATLARELGQMQGSETLAMDFVRRCAVPRCQSLLPSQAVFCPRCGTRVMG